MNPTRYTLPAVLLLFSSVSAAFGQTPTPHQILAAADSVLAAVRTASYVATIINRNLDGEVDTIAARVYLARNPSDSTIGLRLRFEMTDHILTYDGARTLSLSKTEKTVRQFEPTVTMDRYLAGNVAGRFVERLFRRTSSFTKMDTVATVEGIVDIAGTPCYSLRLALEDAEDMKNVRSRWCMGVADGFPHRYEFSGDYLGQPYADTMTYSDVRLNIPMPDSLFTLVVPAGYTYDTLEPYKKPVLLAAGTDAPPWKLATIDGRERTLEDYRGKVIVLDFWYLSCAPCQHSMPVLSELQKRFMKDSVRVIGVNPFDKGPKVAELFAKRRFAYEPLLNGRQVAQDYRVSSYPTMYVIGTDGRIVDVIEGHSEDLGERLGAVVERALRGTDVSGR